MPTDAEKIARYEQWVRFIGQSGTYQISGTTLTFRPVVAKTEELIGRPRAVEFQVQGDALTLTIQSGTRVRFTRLE
jgi:hypothetical protein